MNFESLTGTTGIASAYNKIYVVNNKDLMIIDQYGVTENVKHEFDWITNIVTTELKVFGIYNKDNKYGLFSMDMSSHFFKKVPVTYTPVNLMYHNNLIFVFDTKLVNYLYEANLSLRETNNDYADTNTLNFMTIGLAKDELTFAWSKDKNVFYNGKEKLLTVEGTVLSLLFHQKFLFVIYNSLYNHYSILQYDVANKKNVKTVDGGYISGPPLYSCIYGDDLYISASTNNIIPLNLFDLPGKKGTEQEKKPPRMAYPAFELNKINHRFLTDQVNIDTEKIKGLKDKNIVDTTIAKDSLIRYYVWMFIFFFIVTVLLLAYFFQENSVYPIILLCILFIAFSFLIKNRYLI